MPRACFLALLSGAVLSCGKSGPEPSSVQGIWQLRTVNGRTLPAASQALQGLVAGGVLRLVHGSTWTEFCVDRGAGETSPFRRGGGFEELGDGLGLVLYYSSSGAGSVPPDTLTTSGDRATFHLRQGASVTDILRLDRVGSAETAPSETPSACP